MQFDAVANVYMAILYTI